MQIDVENLMQTFATIRRTKILPRNGERIQVLLPRVNMPIKFYEVGEIPETTDGPIEAVFSFEYGRWILIV